MNIKNTLFLLGVLILSHVSKTNAMFHTHGTIAVDQNQWHEAMAVWNSVNGDEKLRIEKMILHYFYLLNHNQKGQATCLSVDVIVALCEIAIEANTREDKTKVDMKSLARVASLDTAAKFLVNLWEISGLTYAHVYFKTFTSDEAVPYYQSLGYRIESRFPDFYNKLKSFAPESPSEEDQRLLKESSEKYSNFDKILVELCGGPF